MDQTLTRQTALSAKPIRQLGNPILLEDTARYAGCGGLWPLAGALFGLRAKKDYYAVLANFRLFCCSVVSLVAFSRNLKILKNIQRD